MDIPGRGLFSYLSSLSLDLKLRFNDGPVHDVKLSPAQLYHFLVSGTEAELQSVLRFLGDAVTSPMGTKVSDDARWWEKEVVMVHYSLNDGEWRQMPVQRVDVLNWGIGAVPGAFAGFVLAKALGAAGVCALATRGAATGAAVIGAKVGSWVHPFIPGVHDASLRVLHGIEEGVKTGAAYAGAAAETAMNTATHVAARAEKEVRDFMKRNGLEL